MDCVPLEIHMGLEIKGMLLCASLRGQRLNHEWKLLPDPKATRLSYGYPQEHRGI